jgi:hypothetical protein
LTRHFKVKSKGTIELTTARGFFVLLYTFFELKGELTELEKVWGGGGMERKERREGEGEEEGEEGGGGRREEGGGRRERESVGGRFELKTARGFFFDVLFF